MKGYRFYAELPQERKSKGASRAWPFAFTVAGIRAAADQGQRFDVIGLWLDDFGRPYHEGDGTMGAYTVAIAGNQSSYCSGSAGRGYLRTRCTRVPADLARILSPGLFRRIAEDEAREKAFVKQDEESRAS